MAMVRMNKNEKVTMERAGHISTVTEAETNNRISREKIYRVDTVHPILTVGSLVLLRKRK